MSVGLWSSLRLPLKDSTYSFSHGLLGSMEGALTLRPISHLRTFASRHRAPSAMTTAISSSVSDSSTAVWPSTVVFAGTVRCSVPSGPA